MANWQTRVEGDATVIQQAMIFDLWMALLAVACVILGWDAEWGKHPPERRPLALSMYESAFGLLAIVTLVCLLVTIAVIWWNSGWIRALLHFAWLFIAFQMGFIVVNRVIRLYLSIRSRHE